MPVWKSPVFYIGVLLVLAVAGALLAPFVVDLNAYRAGLEDYGKKLTGRTVTIGGPISVRLFPWPRLAAEDVHLANPPGPGEVEFATAERIVVRMALAGLFSGSIQVESIDIEEPVITLERRAEGQGNWSFEPAGDLAENRLLDRVRLDRISLTNGVLRLIDRRRGGEARLENLNASLAAPGIAGPWRLRASVGYRGRPLDIAISTGAWKTGEALRFGFRIAPGDNSGLVYNFDGANDGKKIAGTMQIEPAADREGKEDVEGRIRPLMFKAKVTADFDHVAFDEIEIAPRDPASGGTLVSGSARLALGATMSAEAELSASRIDLDQYAGAEARRLLREGGGFAVADGLLALLPEAVSLKTAFKVTALESGGATLENVLLKLEAAHEAIRVHELSASLPGRSRARFEGVFFPGSAGAELAGNLALEANDLRQLTLWAWPEGKETIGKYWTGSRGRLKVKTEVNVTRNRIGFAKTQYEIDGVGGKAAFSRETGGRIASGLRLEAAEIDIDNFAPGGFAAISPGGAGGLAQLLSMLLPSKEAGDLRLSVQTGLLRLNGVEAKEVTVDLASSAKGLDLKTLAIASVEGARLEASGLILDTGEGPDGKIEIESSAEDPRGLLRLLGLMPGDREPLWAAGLGDTRIKGEIAVKPGETGSAASITFKGRTGVLEIAAAGSLLGGRDIAGTADIESPTSSAIVRLLGLTPAAADLSPGRLAATVEGNPAQGFKTGIQAQLFGTRFDFDGRIGGGGDRLAVDGKASARSTDMSLLMAVSGLPAAMRPSGILVLDAEIESYGGAGISAAIDGRAGASRLAGNLAFGPDGKITGNLETGHLQLTDVLAAAFFPWIGRAAEIDTAFAAGLPLGLTGEIWIAPDSLRVHEGFDASDVQIGITATAEETRMAVFGKDADGRKAIIELASRPGGGGRALDGTIVLPVDLARQLRLAGGEPVASGEGSIELRFATRGRSPGGALAAIRGSGSYSFEDLRLLNISPETFTRRIAEVRDAVGLDAAFAGLSSGGELAAGDISGSVTIDNGVAAFLPFQIKTRDADAAVKTVAELAEGKIDTSVILDLKAMPGLPSMEIAYAGAPSTLARSEDNAALAAALGFQILQKGVDELERLQREQQRLAAEEEKARKEDEARLQAYYAQRDELRLRQRELKVHERVRRQEAERARLEAIRLNAEFVKLNRAEMAMRVRELRLHRRLARLAQQQFRQQRAKEEPEAGVPLILVPPVPYKPPERKRRSLFDFD
ncbi:MAG: AsmA family protein [Hyphomicrobiales bacterium]